MSCVYTSITSMHFNKFCRPRLLLRGFKGFWTVETKAYSAWTLLCSLRLRRRKTISSDESHVVYTNQSMGKQRFQEIHNPSSRTGLKIRVLSFCRFCLPFFQFWHRTQRKNSQIHSFTLLQAGSTWAQFSHISKAWCVMRHNFFRSIWSTLLVLSRPSQSHTWLSRISANQTDTSSMFQPLFCSTPHFLLVSGSHKSSPRSRRWGPWVPMPVDPFLWSSKPPGRKSHDAKIKDSDKPNNRRYWLEVRPPGIRLHRLLWGGGSLNFQATRLYLRLADGGLIKLLRQQGEHFLQVVGVQRLGKADLQCSTVKAA